MGTTMEIRRVPANPGYRYLNKDELVEGLQALMIDIDSEYQTRYPTAGTIVTLDANPMADRDNIPYVYYHCTRPKWEGQCFVPVSKFTTGHHEGNHFHPGGPRHEYWAPVDLLKL